MVAKAMDVSSSEKLHGPIKDTIKNYFKVASQSEVLETA